MYYSFAHINARWLTLSQAFELVIKRWVDCKKYFPEYISKQTEYKGTLTKNKRYAKIRKWLLEDELRVFVQISNLGNFA